MNVRDVRLSGSKEDVDNHIRNELDHHLELSVRRSAETGLKGAQAKERTQELYGQVAEVQQLIAGNVKIMHEAKENIESLKKNIKDVKEYHLIKFNYTNVNWGSLISD
uniref:Uncharacterized protein n=1 Tax=Magallana gigas TaxID=29159 RepID=K1RFJ8_MAGGI